MSFWYKPGKNPISEASTIFSAIKSGSNEDGKVVKEEKDPDSDGIDPDSDGVDKQVKEEVKETPEKTIEKLTERNMLGRLAKQLQLNEEGKNKMFAYFEKGELKQ